MTGSSVLTTVNNIFGSLLEANLDTFVAQKVRNVVRINKGDQILTYENSQFNFTSKYQLISRTTMLKAMNDIKLAIDLSSRYYMQLTPKSWGYKIKFYDGLKVVQKMNIKLFTTNSIILCYLFLAKKFVTRTEPTRARHIPVAKPTQEAKN